MDLILESIYWKTTKEIKKEGKNQREKLAALAELRRLIFGYQSENILFFLIWAITAKKARMILTAQNKTDLKEILKPSVPQGNFGHFSVGPYHVYEEELLLWSQASFVAPLNEDGTKRYSEVFKRSFPEEWEEIWGGKRN